MMATSSSPGLSRDSFRNAWEVMLSARKGALEVSYRWSFWRDEEALKRWREHHQHQQAQQKGRGRIFEDYRIRVAEVIRDYGMSNRKEAP